MSEIKTLHDPFAAWLRAEGIPLHLVADAAEAAGLARAAGLCDDATLDDIEAQLS